MVIKMFGVTCASLAIAVAILLFGSEEVDEGRAVSAQTPQGSDVTKPKNAAPVTGSESAIQTDRFIAKSDAVVETRITGRLLHQDRTTPWMEKTRIYAYRMDPPVRKGAPMTATPKLVGRSGCGAFSMKIEPGRYQLRTESVRAGHTTVGRSPSFVIAEGEEKLLEVLMGNVSRISGEIAWDDGRGFNNVRIIVRPMLDDRDDGTIVLSTEVWTDRSGAFSVDLPYPIPSHHRVIVAPMVPQELRGDIVLEPGNHIRQEWSRRFVFRARKKIPEIRSTHVAFDYRGIPVPIETKVETFVPAGLGTLHSRPAKNAVVEPEREVRTDLPNVTAAILLDGETLASLPHVLVRGTNEIGFQAPLRGDFVLRLTGPDGTLSVPLRPDGRVLQAVGSDWVDTKR